MSRDPAQNRGLRPRWSRADGTARPDGKGVTVQVRLSPGELAALDGAALPSESRSDTVRRALAALSSLSRAARDGAAG
jgi:hypothetical protein